MGTARGQRFRFRPSTAGADCLRIDRGRGAVNIRGRKGGCRSHCLQATAHRLQVRAVNFCLFASGRPRLGDVSWRAQGRGACAGARDLARDGVTARSAIRVAAPWRSDLCPPASACPGSPPPPRMVEYVFSVRLDPFAGRSACCRPPGPDSRLERGNGRRPATKPRPFSATEGIP